MQIAKLETALKKFLGKHSSVTILGYFGSYAMGNPRHDSDIDICLAEKHPLTLEKKIQHMGGRTPSTMTESFIPLAEGKKISQNTAEALVKSVGLRNLLVLEYSKSDWAIVASFANDHLGTFKNFSKEVLSSIP